MNALAGLNAEQKKAAETINGPVMIVAGAGAGKTKTIVHRIAHIIEMGNDPSSILAVTFTNKAAAEMRARIEKILTDRKHSGAPMIATFHALGVYILRSHAHLVGRTKQFTIFDEDDTRSIVKELIVARGLDPKENEPRKFRAIISKYKNQGATFGELQANPENRVEELAGILWEQYEARLKKENGFDFDDLLLGTVSILKNHAEIRDTYLNKWRFVHIDEYQDTNDVQYTLAHLLVGPEKNICVVGDADQTIYTWRGANIKNMLHFERDYPDAKILFLEQNYRSTKKILEAANAIIEKNTARIPKLLFTDNGDGKDIAIYEGGTETEEAEFVADTASALIARGISPNEIAVLYRANFQSRNFEDAFLGRNLPYQVLGTKFFERKEVKDVLSFIRAAQNKESLHDIKRIINIPPRGIGKVTLAKLFAGTESTLPPSTQEKIRKFYTLLETIKGKIDKQKTSDFVRFVIRTSGIEEMLARGTNEDIERLENVKELVTLATKYDTLPHEEGIEALLTSAALASDQDNLKDEKTGVRLMTVHAAKGLEFKYVFIVGLEDGLFPHEEGMHETVEEREEERRLFYVALTRAKEQLYLSHTRMRTIYGNRQINIPSEFISDIPPHLLEQVGKSEEELGSIYI